MGPGKARLLSEIDARGSISAAARAMGMSYRRAWTLVETCNRSFAEPLVVTHPGEGAHLTGTGRTVLAAWTRLDAASEVLASDPDYATIAAMLKRD